MDEMSKAVTFRFYSVSEIFEDDERVMSFALVELLKIDELPEKIYRDLLACRYWRWIDQLEQIADGFEHLFLKEWIAQKVFDLDMSSSYLWAPGDSKIIECNGWKLKNRSEDESDDNL